MKSPGSRFLSGTLSNVILGTSVTALMLYFFLKAGTLDYKYLIFVVVGLAGTVRSYFKFRRLRLQNDIEFIDEH